MTMSGVEILLTLLVVFIATVQMWNAGPAGRDEDNPPGEEPPERERE